MPALEIACGWDRDPRCDTFMDINPAIPDLDYYGSFESLPWLDETFELVVARDCLEHCSYESTDAVLAEWFRVTAPGGRIFIQTPAADVVMKWWCEGLKDVLASRLPVNGPVNAWQGVVWRLLGGHFDGVLVREGDDWRWNAHYQLFGRESLTEAVERAGFVVDVLDTNTHPNYQLMGHRPA